MLISKGGFQSTIIRTSNLISNAQSKEDLSGNTNMHTVQTLLQQCKTTDWWQLAAKNNDY